MVPPTSYSTGIPVLAVKALPITLSTVFFQLPPHTLTTSAFCARAGGTSSGSVTSATRSVPTMRERMTCLLTGVRESEVTRTVRARDRGCQGRAPAVVIRLRAGTGR